jgi:hypothetical protein
MLKRVQQIKVILTLPIGCSSARNDRDNDTSMSFLLRMFSVFPVFLSLNKI